MINEPDYQIVIVGSGAGGAEAALLAARRGARGVLLIEKNLLGGGALHAGTIPMRSLVGSVRTLRQLHRSGSDDAEAGARLSNWVNRQQRTVATLASQLRDELRAAEVEIVRGEATLLGEGRVRITQDGRQDRPGRVVQAAKLSSLQARSRAIPSGSGRRAPLGIRSVSFRSPRRHFAWGSLAAAISAANLPVSITRSAQK